jgi:hypothetical protein
VIKACVLKQLECPEVGGGKQKGEGNRAYITKNLESQRTLISILWEVATQGWPRGCEIEDQII